MKFVQVYGGYLNPHTVEVVNFKASQYGMVGYDGIDGTQYFEHCTIEAVLSSGQKVTLESWDTRRAPDVDNQERLDYWLQVISEAME